MLRRYNVPVILHTIAHEVRDEDLVLAFAHRMWARYVQSRRWVHDEGYESLQECMVLVHQDLGVGGIERGDNGLEAVLNPDYGRPGQHKTVDAEL